MPGLRAPADLDRLAPLPFFTRTVAVSSTARQLAGDLLRLCSSSCRESSCRSDHLVPGARQLAATSAIRPRVSVLRSPGSNGRRPAWPRRGPFRPGRFQRRSRRRARRPRRGDRRAAVFVSGTTTACTRRDVAVLDVFYRANATPWPLKRFSRSFSIQCARCVHRGEMFRPTLVSSG